jgi:hypothetical protein
VTSDAGVISESGLTTEEVRKVREMLDRQAIQAVLLRYIRGIDRNDPVEGKTIYWDEAIDEHGSYSGSAKGFLERALENKAGHTARYHMLGPARIDFVDERTAHVESYFLYLGTSGESGEERLTVLAGRYRDLFEKRADEWRVLHRAAVYDVSGLSDYAPKWTEIGISANRLNHGVLGVSDPIYDASW